MDQSLLFNLKESLQSRNDRINEEKQEFLEAFRKDGMPLGEYPKLLTEKEWTTTKDAALWTALEYRFRGTAAYNKLLSTSLGKFLPDTREKGNDMINSSFLPNQRQGKKGGEPLPNQRQGKKGGEQLPAPPPSLKPDFAQPDLAAVSAIDDHNPTSRRRNKEYGGNVCEITLNPNNGPRYTYTATPGEVDHVYPDNAPCPSGTKRVAAWHTHGGKDRRFDSERFSTNDINYARENHIPLFVGTPGQKMMVVIPKGVRGAEKDKVLTCPRNSR